MPKSLLWVGLLPLIFGMVAACGATPPANERPGSSEPEVAAEHASVSPEAEVAEAASDVSSVAQAEPTTPSAVSAAATSEGDAANQAEVGCDNPFAGVENLRFTTDIWTAAQISRFVSPALVDPNSGLATNFCKHSIDYNEVLSGGPPPDGIPPLDNPSFESVAEADAWLDDRSPLIALTVGDEAKAYPLGILTRHEIANDEIAGLPVAVTFCPLCNAGIVFKREVEGEVLRFGVSGNLRHSDLIMWDNQTLSWWQQFTGEAIVGEATGTQLEMLPAQLVAWKDFKAAHPDGLVLSSNGRNYDANPYTGYDSTTQPFLFLGTPDDRLPATERVLGYFRGEVAKAYPLPLIEAEKVIEDTLDGRRVVIFFEPGQASALDQSVISSSKEVGSAGIFIPEANGRPLSFTYRDGTIMDNETGSQWDIFGRAVSGELVGTELEPVLSHTHFWFAWAAFRPDTAIYGSE